MEIIFNSDMLYSKSLRRKRLPRHIEDFLVACEDAPHHIIIPRTTLYEYQRVQAELLASEIQDVAKAKELLLGYGVQLPEFDAAELVSGPALEELLPRIGNGELNFTVVDATTEEYENALRKACLREEPHPPASTSDEMRDLVIWELALRIARENDGALLLSRDVVHIHHRGDGEARQNRLLRAPDFERALEMLDIDTPAARKVHSLVDDLWDKIVASELPLKDGAHLTSIKSPVFMDLEDGTTKVQANVLMATGDGKVISAEMTLFYFSDQVISVEFHGLSDNKGKEFQSFDVKSDKDIEIVSDAKERLNDLFAAIGD